MLAAVSHVVQVPPAALSYGMGFVVPVLVAILAKSSASAPLKTVLNAVLVCVAGLLAASLKLQGSVDLYAGGVAIAEAAVASWASYNGFWKPSGLTGSVHQATGKFGIG